MRRGGSLLASPSADSHSPPAAAPGVRRAGASVRAAMPKTILLADDHEDNRSALLTVLERHGYATLGASNGREAVDLVRERRPDLVLMDLAMPVMDGRTAMRTLRDDPDTADVPIVVLTAMALSVDREKLEAEGFDGLLIKPCMPPHLIQEVRRMIGPPEGDAERGADRR